MAAQLHGQSIGCMKMLCGLSSAAQRVLQVQLIGPCPGGLPSHMYRHCTATVRHCTGHCTGTVRALYGHCMGTMKALYRHCTGSLKSLPIIAADIYASKHAHVHNCQQRQ